MNIKPGMLCYVKPIGNSADDIGKVAATIVLASHYSGDVYGGWGYVPNAWTCETRRDGRLWRVYIDQDFLVPITDPDATSISDETEALEAADMARTEGMPT